MTDHTPPTTQQLDDTYRDDVREILEAEGWHETAEDTVVADNGALWTETNDCRDSGVDAPDKSWSVAFDSGVPASVIAAVAVVAGGTDLVAEVRRLRADRNRYRNAWHNARARAVDGWTDAKLAETRAADLDAGRRADSDRIAELEPYEMLAPQQCPAGKHAEWLVDSEYAHACPWCQIEELRTQLASAHRDRDLAIAHDRQPYPTAWAYEQACKALNRKTEAVDQVRAMHKPRTERHGSGCVQCGIVWPCPTYTALDEAAAVVPAVVETGEAGA